MSLEMCVAEEIIPFYGILYMKCWLNGIPELKMSTAVIHYLNIFIQLKLVKKLYEILVWH